MNHFMRKQTHAHTYQRAGGVRRLPAGPAPPWTVLDVDHCAQTSQARAVPTPHPLPLVEGGLLDDGLDGLDPRLKVLCGVGLVLRLAQVLLRRALERLEQPHKVRLSR